MTTMYEKKVQCCVCGKKSNHKVVRSSYSHGSSDLDTRPPEMTRSTIYYSIQRCPSCGYCASDLSECSGDVKFHVESKAYQEIIGNKAIPKVAASFLALSYEKQQTHPEKANLLSSAFLLLVFQHIDFLQLKPLRFLFSKFRNNVLSMNDRQFIPAGGKGGTPGFAACSPV